MRAVFVALLLAGSSSAFAMEWGPINPNSCLRLDVRQYSAQLNNIPSGTSWSEACYSMPATIDGTYYPSPNRCVGTPFGVWGEWDIPDTGCPHFGPVYGNSCLSSGGRAYWAELRD